MNYYQLHVLHQYIKLEHPGLKQTNVLEVCTYLRYTSSSTLIPISLFLIPEKWWSVLTKTLF